MEILLWIVVGVAVAVGSAVLWGRKRFRHEIDRVKRMNRANRDGR